MTLREILNYIEFDYEIIKENGIRVIRLIDKQDVYLGTIRDERWEAEMSSVPCIIDRLGIYWNDYVIQPLLEDMGRDESEFRDWTEIYAAAEKFYGHEVHRNTILWHILNPDGIYIEDLPTVFLTEEAEEALEKYSAENIDFNLADGKVHVMFHSDRDSFPIGKIFDESECDIKKLKEEADRIGIGYCF